MNHKFMENHMKSVEVIKERIQHIINVMEGVDKTGGKVYMGNWWSDLTEPTKFEDGKPIDYQPLYTTEEFRESVGKNFCGTAACMVGWCALDERVNPENYSYFNADGVIGFIKNDIDISERNYRIINDQIVKITLINGVCDENDETSFDFYGKRLHEVTAKDIIQKLYEFKDMIE